MQVKRRSTAAGISLFAGALAMLCLGAIPLLALLQSVFAPRATPVVLGAPIVIGILGAGAGLIAGHIALARREMPYRRPATIGLVLSYSYIAIFAGGLLA